MSLTRKIAHNTAIQFAGKIGGTIIALVTMSLMLRYLGKTGFGQYSTAINFLAVFAILIDLGLYLIVTREISKEGADESKLVSNTLTFRFVIGLAVLSLAPLISLFMPYADITRLAILVNASAFLFMSLNQILTGVFQKHLRMEKVAIGEIAARVFWLISVLIVVELDAGLLWIVATNSIAALINFIILHAFSRKYIKISFAFDFALWKKLWKSAAPLALNVVLNLVYFKAGIIILTLLDTEAAVGTLGAAQKILENLITFSAIFAGLLFPLFARWIKKDQDQFKKVLQKGFDALSILVFPLVAGSIWLAEDIVVLFGGADFVDSAPVLQVLMVAVGAIFFGNLFGNVIVAADLQKKIVPVYVVNALLAVVMSFVLIPQISYFGAAYATLLTEIIVAIAAFFVVKKFLKISLKYDVVAKAIVSALAMIGVLFVMPDDTNIIVNIIGGAGVYGILMFAMGAISKEVIMEIVSLRSQAKS